MSEEYYIDVYLNDNGKEFSNKKKSLTKEEFKSTVNKLNNKDSWKSLESLEKAFNELDNKNIIIKPKENLYTKSTISNPNKKETKNYSNDQKILIEKMNKNLSEKQNSKCENTTRYAFEDIQKDDEVIEKENTNTSIDNEAKEASNKLNQSKTLVNNPLPVISNNEKPISKYQVEAWFDTYPENEKEPEEEVNKKTLSISKNLSQQIKNKTIIDNLDFADILEQMNQIHIAKNNDYGSSFDKAWDKFGIQSLVQRLYDKYNRLEQLTTKGTTQMVKDESIIDTLLDMANYAVMGIVRINKDNNSK